ncbi:MAG: phosphoribosylformylglycinamidine synthase subunit PurL [Pirellulales bacterium]|nr:phosphoribosylformylglycinamidine synthase subunit PurL [Pirellulales bacterium]
MLWQVDIYPAHGHLDRSAVEVINDATDLGFEQLEVVTSRGYLLEGDLNAEQIRTITDQLLVDPVVERTVVAPVGDAELNKPPQKDLHPLHVLLKPGVMDPVAQSALSAITDLQINVKAIRTLKKYWLPDLENDLLTRLAGKILANDAIEQIVSGPLDFEQLHLGTPYEFELQTVPIRPLDSKELSDLSRTGQLYLQLAEMETIRDYYRNIDRDPTNIELETLAQTWSEHCSHKTLAGRIAYQGPIDETGTEGSRKFENMLKETIFAATVAIRKNLGEKDWCVSVFEDNAGIVRFDRDHNVVFKVETHNHPSALEPYGGANTGIGGVIRDPLGTGLGARPVCNTDIFCFARPDYPAELLPQGVLHPRRVMKGVVAGVRDYGNRMGIPTVNGAIYFDDRYLGNPLVYCGTVGILPSDKSFGAPKPGDHIVAIGGRTGRDGIHGATFSSAELTEESESLSGGAVQIGNAITEKMVLDVVIAARDRGLYHAITDCGAGGFSSAVGEMGEKIGAEVYLEQAPVKYEGLSYTEIWISEAQERMVLSVSEKQWPELEALCASEDVEATIIGRFVPTGQLTLKYHDTVVGELPMEFLHDGRPPVIREATYVVPTEKPLAPMPATVDWGMALIKILGSLNVASKEWVIRQYDHEVQAGSAIKPLVGVTNDGPSDAAVVRPVLSSRRGIVVGCGMNPHYGDLDTYHMAASGIDEAIRNCVAVGADPARIAILDNFCWGDCEKSETLGSLVRAALACYDLALAFDTPFISGKDSLNNEFSYFVDGKKQSIAIPSTLLISAMGQVDAVDQCITMDLKSPDNLIYQVGVTKNELGGSHFSLTNNLSGGRVPRVDVAQAKANFFAIHAAIQKGLICSCHDMSEGGLGVALAEMAFAGGFGVEVQLAACPHEEDIDSDTSLFFSESNSRFLCEVSPEAVPDFEAMLAESHEGQTITFARIGKVTEELTMIATGQDGTAIVNIPLTKLKEAWQKPLAW